MSARFVIDTARGENCDDLGPAGLANDGCSSVCTGEFAAWRTLPRGASTPLARRNHAMVYDLERGVVVLFGGSNGLYLNDTWEFDGKGWIQRSPTSSPSPRMFTNMIYDPARRTTVLYGGFASGRALDDSWEYDGTSWVQRRVATTPGPRESPAMGGSDSSGWRDDTWTYDGDTWTQRVTLFAPAPRIRMALALDLARNQLVGFGGIHSATVRDGQLWELTPTTWIRRRPPVEATPHSSAGMAFFGKTNELIVFGGWDGVTFDGNTLVYAYGSAESGLRDQCEAATLDSDGDGRFPCALNANATPADHADPDCWGDCLKPVGQGSPH